MDWFRLFLPLQNHILFLLRSYQQKAQNIRKEPVQITLSFLTSYSYNAKMSMKITRNPIKLYACTQMDTRISPFVYMINVVISNVFGIFRGKCTHLII